MAPLSPCHPEPLLPFGIPNLFSRLEFRASSPAVIPSAERDLQLGKWRETVAGSKRFLVVALLARNDRGGGNPRYDTQKQARVLQTASETKKKEAELSLRLIPTASQFISFELPRLEEGVRFSQTCGRIAFLTDRLSGLYRFGDPFGFGDRCRSFFLERSRNKRTAAS